MGQLSLMLVWMAMGATVAKITYILIHKGDTEADCSFQIMLWLAAFVTHYMSKH